MDRCLFVVVMVLLLFDLFCVSVGTVGRSEVRHEAAKEIGQFHSIAAAQGRNEV